MTEFERWWKNIHEDKDYYNKYRGALDPCGHIWAKEGWKSALEFIKSLPNPFKEDAVNFRIIYDKIEKELEK